VIIYFVVTKLIYEDPEHGEEDPESNFDQANAQFDGREQALIAQQERMGLVAGVVTDGDANRYNPANPFNESKFIDPEKFNRDYQDIGGGIASSQAQEPHNENPVEGYVGPRGPVGLHEEPENFNPYLQQQHSEPQLIPTQNQQSPNQELQNNAIPVVQQQEYDSRGIEMAKQPQMMYQQEIAEISNINDMDGGNKGPIGDETRDLPNLLKDLEMYNHDNTNNISPRPAQQREEHPGSGNKDEGYDPYNF